MGFIFFDWYQKEVDEDNAKFKKELEEFEKKNLDKFEQFVNKYREDVANVQKQVAEIAPGKDPRIQRFLLLHDFVHVSSYLVFLEKLGLSPLMMAQAIRENYQTIFDR